MYGMPTGPRSAFGGGQPRQAEPMPNILSGSRPERSNLPRDVFGNTLYVAIDARQANLAERVSRERSFIPES